MWFVFSVLHHVYLAIGGVLITIDLYVAMRLMFNIQNCISIM